MKKRWVKTLLLNQEVDYEAAMAFMANINDEETIIVFRHSPGRLARHRSIFTASVLMQKSSAPNSPWIIVIILEYNCNHTPSESSSSSLVVINSLISTLSFSYSLILSIPLLAFGVILPLSSYFLFSCASARNESSQPLLQSHDWQLLHITHRPH